MSSGNSTTNNSSIICDPFLFSLGNFSTESSPSSTYGVCPDALTTPIFSGLFIGLYLVLYLVNTLGIIKFRKKGRIKSRDPLYLFVCMCVHAVFIVGFLLRFTVGRKLFPCALYTLLYFLLPAAVSLPTTLRCIRIYTMYRLNLFKTKIFDIDHEADKNRNNVGNLINIGNNKPTGMDQELQIKPEMVTVNTPTTNHDESSILVEEVNRHHDGGASPALTLTSDDNLVAQPLQEEQQGQQQPSSEIVLPIADVTSDSSIQHDTTTTTMTDDKALPNNTTTYIESPMNIISRQLQAIDPSSLITNTDPTDSNDDEFTFTLNSKSVWDISDSNEQVRAQIRTMQILSFLSSYKFMIISYSALIVFQIILWLLFGAIEEIIFAVSSSQQENKRAFLLEGGLFVFNHGCALSTNFVIIFACVSILYIILEIIALILCFRADRDTWNMKRDTILLVILQVICVVLFAIAGNVEFIVILTDYIVPYGYTLVLYTFFEIGIYTSIPLLKTLMEAIRPPSTSHNKRDQHETGTQKGVMKNLWWSRRNMDQIHSPASSPSTTTLYLNKAISIHQQQQQQQHQSEIERILLNKRTFDIMLDFARRSYCVESVLAWRDIRRFKSSRLHKRKIAQHVVNTYLTIGSPFELNISNIVKKREDYMNVLNSDAKITSSFFDKLEEHCLYDMRDVFTRLRNSNKEIDDLVYSFE
ncbi:hypothetical protein C9374_008565 [Naegleria lovaniensis]|uniref:RGS domain-containing protein n=1 Tax=Naegleria lovaniensis TaxID=51637 RepID=A0AA88GG53_NAELO|nr:uncharacterized protein C9374_008565 [Naegleria lovaniensis]KAG2377943.1 hypothetical protein C9374_008565 [Naegleria lovaniensis]